MRRKLVAILVADIVGYSRLMGIDETGTHAAVKGHLKEQIQPTIRRCKGRLVKTMGDGVIVAFESAVNAVLCAVELQDGFAKWNKSVPADRQLHFRIGVNLGDVMLDGDDVYGDGVNIADRIQALADADSILVSQTVFQHVKDKVPISFEDLGERTVKNIAEPVRIFRVVTPRLPGGAVPMEEAVTSANPSIAILPFVNMSGDPEQQYYSDGITEDIITELSRFRTISVIARNSSFVYRDKPVDVKQIGQELGVQFVVEGSVRKLEHRVRITVQLVHAESRRHVWAERYDVEHSEIFSIQDDVTHRVAAMVVPKIETEELILARRRPTGQPRAYDCYLRGKSCFYAARDGTGIAEARRHFEEAIEIDPQFASAYSYLARIDNNLTMYSAAGTSLAPLRERAWNEARKAAALDDSDPHAHICLAWCHLWRREFEAARKHLDMATRLNPNDPDRAMDRGTTLIYLGEPEAAIEVMTTGIRLNPFHPDSYLADLAEAYFVARRYDDMIGIAERIADPSPRFAAWKAAAYAFAGREAEARREADKFLANVRAIWAGDAGAGPAEFVAWLLSFSPFRRREDVEHFVSGLRQAGLEGKAAEEPGGFDSPGEDRSGFEHRPEANRVS